MILQRLKVVSLVLSILILAALACGGNVEPEKVGVVEQAPDEVEGEQTAGGEQAEQSSTTTEVQPEATEAIPSQTEFAIGDIIEIGPMTIIVLGWSEPPGNEIIKPDEGNKFISVELLLVNRGDTPTGISSLVQMNLKDAQNYSYDVNLIASTVTGTAGVDGEISPGEKIRGTVGFQVPVDATDFVFVYDVSAFSTGKVFIPLGPDPTQVEAPAEVAGERQPDLFAIGDIIAIGDYNLTVNGISYPEGDQINKPGEGKLFLGVDISIENTSSEAKNFSTLFQMWVKDSTAQRYAIDLFASAAAGNAFPDRELAPGETVRGIVGFRIPDDASGLVFVFDANLTEHGKVFVSLGN